MTSRYKRFLQVCQRYPILSERGKAVTTLGTYIQQQVKNKFVYKESTQLKDPVKCDRILSSLERLANDHYKNKYNCSPRVTVKINDLEQLSKGIDELFTQKPKTKNDFSI